MSLLGIENFAVRCPESASGTKIARELQGFVPIGLDELNSRARLQRRVDAKYVVPTAQLGQILGLLPEPTRVLSIGTGLSQTYRSVYFDTPCFDSYLNAARGRRRRFKLRTREYTDSGLVFVEVKTRGARGVTVKQRAPHSHADLAGLSVADTEFAAHVLAQDQQDPAIMGRMAPVLATGYQRSTLLVPGATADSDVRLTIDTGLTWELASELGRRSGGVRGIRCDGLSIVEVKSPLGVHTLTRTLSRHGLRPTKISKYATGLSLLVAHLPAHKWTRTKAVLQAHSTGYLGNNELQF